MSRDLGFHICVYTLDLSLGVLQVCYVSVELTCLVCVLVWYPPTSLSVERVGQRPPPSQPPPSFRVCKLQGSKPRISPDLRWRRAPFLFRGTQSVLTGRQTFWPWNPCAGGEHLPCLGPPNPSSQAGKLSGPGTPWTSPGTL